MLKIRRSWDRLIFSMGIPILVRRHLHIETAPWMLFQYQYRNSHYKDNTISRQSYLYDGDSHTWKDRLYIEAAPWLLEKCIPPEAVMLQTQLNPICCFLKRKCSHFDEIFDITTAIFGRKIDEHFLKFWCILVTRGAPEVIKMTFPFRCCYTGVWDAVFDVTAFWTSGLRHRLMQMFWSQIGTRSSLGTIMVTVSHESSHTIHIARLSRLTMTSHTRQLFVSLLLANSFPLLFNT